MTEVDKLLAQWEKNDEAELASALSELVQHRAGRRLVWWLLTVGRWGSQPYAADPIATAFACGELNVGQKIADRLLTQLPEVFTQMMKENADERRDRDIQLGNAADRDRDGPDAGDDTGEFDTTRYD